MYDEQCLGAASKWLREQATKKSADIGLYDVISMDSIGFVQVLEAAGHHMLSKHGCPNFPYCSRAKRDLQLRIEDKEQANISAFANQQLE